MGTPLPQLIPQRVHRVRREVEGAIWRRVGEVPVSGSRVFSEPVSVAAAGRKRYTAVAPGSFFGPARGGWCQRWFALRVQAPPKDVTRHLFWRCQGETTVYHRGEPWAGLDGAHPSCPLPPAGGRLLLDCGTYQTGDWAFTREPILEYGLRFDGAHLADRDEDIWQAHHDLEILAQLMEHQLALSGWKNVNAFGYQPDLVRATPLLRRLLAGLEEAAAAWDRGGVDALRPRLRKLLTALPAETWQPRATLAGHSHLDPVFMWPEREGERKGVHTVATMLRLTEAYPDFRVTWTQPALLEAVGHRAPGLLRAVQRHVRAGRWELTGGMEVEAENQIPCGEALARCLIYGQRRLAELKGGKPSTVVWLPDCFGFTACLPQLMVQTGVTGFFSGKMGWSQISRAPHTSFVWRGSDGSEVVAHHSPAPVTNATVADLAAAAEHDRQGGVTGEFLGWIGMGDGGGGTRDVDIERLRRLADLAVVPRCGWGKAEEFFARLNRRRAELPVYQGEMYLEYHRGTYTSQAEFKTVYRQLERALQAREAAHVLMHRPPVGFEAWKRLLFAQFHDALPGSAIALVYEQLTPELQQQVQEHHRQTLRMLSCRRKGWSVFNPVPMPQRVVADLGPGMPAQLTDGAGEPVPTQRVARKGKSRMLALLDLPAAGTTVLRASAGKRQRAAAAPAGEISSRSMDNGLVQVRLTADGRVDGLVVEGRELLLDGPAGLCLHSDRPANFETWDIDREALLAGEPVGVSPRVVEKGPLRFVLEGEGALGQAGRVVLRYILHAGCPWLRVEADIDWQESDRLLKFRVPTGYHGRMARFGTPFGSILRSQLPGLPHDEAMWEVPGNRWAAVLDDNQRDGLAVVTEARYGFSCRDGVLAASLLRAPTDSSEARPQRIDQGRHRIRLALSAHRDRSSGHTPGTAAAAELLYGELVVAQGAAARSAGVRLEQPGSLVASWILPAETRSGVLLRLHETAGAGGNAVLCVDDPRRRVTLVDLLERPAGKPARIGPGQWRIDYSPYQVLTVLLVTRNA